MNIFIPLSWTIFLIILLLMPGSSIPQSSVYDIPNIDKFAHFVLFAGLTFWWGLYLKSRVPANKWKSAIWTLAASGILLGIVIEFLQLNFIPFRDFDLLDIAANSSGAIVAALVLVFFLKNNN